MAGETASPYATIMADVTPGNFEIGPAVVALGETKLGGTDGAVSLSVEPVTKESKCNQAGDDPVGIYIVGYKVSVKAKFKEISKILSVLVPSGKLSAADFGKNLLAATGGTAKALTVIGLKRSFKLPHAVSISAWEYAIDGVEEHGIEVTFTGYQDSTGVYLEQITAA